MTRIEAFDLANQIETETNGKAIVKYEILGENEYKLIITVNDPATGGILGSKILYTRP